MKILSYVLQEHNSKHQAQLHYDFRFKYPQANRLASWAIPKAEVPSKGKKLLAIRTPDHAMKWLKFSGEIREKYGEGFVRIVQSGRLELEFYSSTKLIFSVISGNGPLQGRYILIKINKKNKNGQEEWIFIKGKDF